MLQAMKIPDAKAAVEKECKNSRRFQPGSWRKVRSKKEVIPEAQKSQAESPLAALMDICHLKNES